MSHVRAFFEALLPGEQVGQLQVQLSSDKSHSTLMIYSYDEKLLKEIAAKIGEYKIFNDISNVIESQIPVVWKSSTKDFPSHISITTDRIEKLCEKLSVDFTAEDIKRELVEKNYIISSDKPYLSTALDIDLSQEVNRAEEKKNKKTSPSFVGWVAGGVKSMFGFGGTPKQDEFEKGHELNDFTQATSEKETSKSKANISGNNQSESHLKKSATTTQPKNIPETTLSTYSSPQTNISSTEEIELITLNSARPDITVNENTSPPPTPASSPPNGSTYQIFTQIPPSSMPTSTEHLVPPAQLETTLVKKPKPSTQATVLTNLTLDNPVTTIPIPATSNPISTSTSLPQEQLNPTEAIEQKLNTLLSTLQDLTKTLNTALADLTAAERDLKEICRMRPHI